ncbi:MAG: exosortase A [Pseudomonadota bacterium]|nr:exosortase A [Pseudomonadota bacterium]
MKSEHEKHLWPEPELVAVHQGAYVWRLCGLLIFASLIWLFTWYGETTLSTLAIWQRSDTYAHGFLIFPISAYLIWTRRQELLMLLPRPSTLGLVALMGLGFVWLLADSAEVLVASQYALVAMVPVLVWAVLGHRVGLALLFPLLFLLFAVPVGEFLLLPLMNFTADFTVTALRITGIPVFREGNFFTVPSGSWSVVEACSGLRYLIASLTLGCLFAYLTYRSIWRRIAFIALSIIVPIIANGFRAYLIVMIGHLSNNKLATGVDHVIYGWVFFGFVMMLLFWLGSRWRESHKSTSSKEAKSGRGLDSAAAPLGKIAAFGAASALIAAVWPTYARHLDMLPPNPAPITLTSPVESPEWQMNSHSITDWQPLFLTAQGQFKQAYHKDGKYVELLVKYYRNQHQDAELINSSNQLTSTHRSTWGRISNESRQLRVGDRLLSIVEAKLTSPRSRLLVWTWYWVGGHYTDNVYLAKIYHAKAKLLNQGDDAAAIFVYTSYDDSSEPARELLNSFVLEMFPAIDVILAHAKR